MKKKTIWLLCVLIVLVLCLFTSCKKKKDEKTSGNSDVQQEETIHSEDEVVLPVEDLEDEKTSIEDSGSGVTGAGTQNGNTHNPSETQGGSSNTNSETQNGSDNPSGEKDDETSDSNTTTREPIVLPGIKLD